jgi:hypothetical protein
VGLSANLPISPSALESPGTVGVVLGAYSLAIDFVLRSHESGALVALGGGLHEYGSPQRPSKAPSTQRSPMTAMINM